MKQNISLVRIFILVAVLVFAAPLLLPSGVHAQTPPAAPAAGACSGNVIAGLCFPRTELPGNGGTVTIEGILTNFMQWLLGIFAILAIISFIISGIQYFLSAGNPDSAKKAKQTMVYSIIGVVVALSSLVIIYAVNNFLTATNTF